MLFVGLDMGVYNTAYGVVNGRCQIIDFGLIYKSPKDFPRFERENRAKGQKKNDPDVNQIAKDHFGLMTEIIEKFHPKTVCSENMMWSAGHSNTQALVHHFRGIMHSVCIIYDTPFQLITPQQIKKIVTGSGGADKNGVADKIYEMSPESFKSQDWLRRNNHISDALGAAIFTASEVMSIVDDDFEEYINSLASG
jgi:Holliday junction resolvasome RuvABC endonuclease subunit